MRLAELERDMTEIATRAHEAEREAGGLKAQLVDEGVSRSKAVAALEADLRLLRTDLAYRVEAAEQSADTLTEMGGVLAERTGALEASRSLLEKVLDYVCVGEIEVEWLREGDSERNRERERVGGAR